MPCPLSKMPGARLWNRGATKCQRGVRSSPRRRPCARPRPRGPRRASVPQPKAFFTITKRQVHVTQKKLSHDQHAVYDTWGDQYRSRNLDHGTSQGTSSSSSGATHGERRGLRPGGSRQLPGSVTRGKEERRVSVGGQAWRRRCHRRACGEEAPPHGETRRLQRKQRHLLQAGRA